MADQMRPIERMEITRDLQKQIDAIMAMEATQVLAMFAECLRTTFEKTVLMAACIRRLQDLNCDFEVLAPELTARPEWSYLRRIAEGNLSPALYHRFRFNKTFLRLASQLPTSDQERLAQNQPVRLAVSGGDHRMVAPSDLTPRQIEQVFGEGELRSDSKQLAWLEDQAVREEMHEDSTDVEDFEIDRRHKRVKILRPRSFTAAELSALLNRVMAC